jgi:hypothetical protein
MERSSQCRSIASAIVSLQRLSICHRTAGPKLGPCNAVKISVPAVRNDERRWTLPLIMRKEGLKLLSLHSADTAERGMPRLSFFGTFNHQSRDLLR